MPEFRGYENDPTTVLTDEEAEFLRFAARDGPGKGSILEIGTYKGKSTVNLALGSKEVGREKVFSIDSETFIETELNFKAFNVLDWIIPIKGLSWEVANDWDMPIRLLYIDGDHRKSRVDYNNFSKFLVEDAIVIFHDITDARVRKTISTLINDESLRKVGSKDWWNMGWFFKGSEISE